MKYVKIKVMPAFIPLKYSLLMLLGGLKCAVGMVFLLNFLFSGPRLGPHYDFLLNLQKPPVVSNEILIIDTDELVDGSDIFKVFMTLTEMEAANLIMTGKVSPSSSPIMLTEAEIRRRFIDEYSLVGANIRSLFEGIRMGSVTPVLAPSYVERLVELTELGRDRLLSALVDRDEDLIRSVHVFGNYLEVDTEPLADWDGVIRRLKITDTNFDNTVFEHPVYLNLKNRYVASQIEYSEYGKILWLRRSDGVEFDIPLDKNGNVITAWNCNFRRIDISIFRQYEEAVFSLREALITADELGAFSQIMPEQRTFELPPLFLLDYSLTLMEDLLQLPSDENRIAWRDARSDFLKSLNDYFNSPAFMYKVGEYEELIADTDPSNEAVLEELIAMRNAFTDAYVSMYEEYNKFSSLHKTLKEELGFSYCIMGPQDKTMYSSLIANVLITGSFITYAYDRDILFWSILSVSAVLLIIFLLRPFFLLFAGIILSVLSSAVYALIFVFNSFWMDPAIVFGSALAGTLIIFYCKCMMIRYRAQSFRTAYGAVVSKTLLQELIARGRPRLSEVNVTYAAIIAIKETNLLGKEDREKTKDAGKVRSAFLSSVKKVIFNAGAVIVGFEGDTILACFGSPLEPHPSLAVCKISEDGTPVARSYSPVDKACALVTGLLDIENNTWRFGIDAGECTFYLSPETGYSVNGRPAVRARLLVSKTSRFKVRALITDTIRKKIDMEGEQLGTLYNKNDAFFAMSNNN